MMAYDAWQGATPPEFIPAVPKPDDKAGQQRRSWYYENPKRLYQGQLPITTPATLYTAPAAPTSGPPPKTKVLEIIICNTDTSTRTVTLYAYPSGGSASAATAIMSAATVAASTTTIIAMDMIMEAGGVMKGVSDAADKVTLTISGIEYLTLPTA